MLCSDAPSLRLLSELFSVAAAAAAAAAAASAQLRAHRLLYKTRPHQIPNRPTLDNEALHV